MNKYIKYFLYSAMALTLVGCQEEEKVNPGEKDLDGCYKVYFPEQSATSDVTLDPADPSTGVITVSRGNASGDIEVPVEIVDTSKLFSVSPIVFKDGQSETTCNLTFDGVVVGKSYSISITITDPMYASKYSSNPVSIDFTVIKEKWNDLGAGTWYENGDVGYWRFTAPAPVEIFQNDNNKNLFRIRMSDPTTGETVYSDNQDEYFVFRVLQPGDELSSGVSITQSDLVIFNIFNTGIYNKNYPSAPIWMVHPNSFGSLADESNFTHNKVLQYQEDGTPAGVQIAPYYYISGVGGWNMTQEDDDITIVFPGAVLTDYSMSVSVGECSNGSVPVSFTKGADVDSVHFAVYEGELSLAVRERYAKAIAEGTEENAHVAPKEGALSMSFGASGTYTIVAVAFGDGVYQSDAYDVFNYVKHGDEDNYEVDVTLGIELTSKYANKGYTKINSAEFFVYGSGLTDVKIGLIETDKLEDVDADSLNVLISDVESIDDSELELVNGDGLVDLFTGLDPLTSYTMVVKASNGYLATIVEAEVTTEGLANILKGKGDYVYTVGVTSPVTDKGLELYQNPNYENTYQIPDWYYGVNFTFNFDPATGKVRVPAQFTGYTSSYGDVYVIEAKDYYTEEDDEYADLIDSKYDAESHTFTFCVAYVVPGVVTFGAGEETFTLDEAVDFSTASTSSVKPYEVKIANFGKSISAEKLNKVVKKASAKASVAGLNMPMERKAGAAVEFEATPIQKAPVDFNKNQNRKVTSNIVL